MKTNHEMLKEIIDVIGYKIPYDTINKIQGGFDFIKEADIGENSGCIVDEREIIFTGDFMNKLDICFLKKFLIDATEKLNLILYHLDNPTLYIYKTLGLGKQ